MQTSKNKLEREATDTMMALDRNNQIKWSLLHVHCIAMHSLGEIVHGTCYFVLESVDLGM